MAKSDNPSNEFRQSFARLSRDIDIAFQEFCQNFAPRIRAYLWVASIGEARHAHRFCNMHVKNLKGNGRTGAMQYGVKYGLTKDNIEKLHSVFAQKWQASQFGGYKWGEIVDAIEMYSEVGYATFIDHCVDLEHNGGNVFNKTDAKDVVQFNVYGVF